MGSQYAAQFKQRFPVVNMLKNVGADDPIVGSIWLVDALDIHNPLGTVRRNVRCHIFMDADADEAGYPALGCKMQSASTPKLGFVLIEPELQESMSLKRKAVRT
jgi:hypothetical protein